MKDVSKGDKSGGGILSAIDTVFYIVQYVGSGIAVIMVIRLGISYMVASPADKAEVKKKMMPTLIGAVLIFGVANLLTILSKITELN